MKKAILKLVLIYGLLIILTSCSYRLDYVGKGAQGTEQITKKNHYLFGVIPLSVADTRKMAGGATDYSIQTYTSFGNGVFSAITLGIYTPTTTIVTK